MSKLHFGVQVVTYGRQVHVLRLDVKIIDWEYKDFDLVDKIHVMQSSPLRVTFSTWLTSTCQCTNLRLKFSPGRQIHVIWFNWVSLIIESDICKFWSIRPIPVNFLIWGKSYLQSCMPTLSFERKVEPTFEMYIDCRSNLSVEDWTCKMSACRLWTFPCIWE